MKKIIRLAGTLLPLLALTACQKAEISLSKEAGEKVIAKIANNVLKNTPKLISSYDGVSYVKEYLINDGRSLDSVMKETYNDSISRTVDLNKKITFSAFITTEKTIYVDGSEDNFHSLEYVWEFIKDGKIVSATESYQRFNGQNSNHITEWRYRNDIPNFDNYIKNQAIEDAILKHNTVSENYLENIRDDYFNDGCQFFEVDKSKVNVESDTLAYSVTGSYKNANFAFSNRITFDVNAIDNLDEDCDLNNIGNSTYTAFYNLHIEDGFSGYLLSNATCTTQTKDSKTYLHSVYKHDISVSETDAISPIPDLNEFTYIE